MSDLFSNQQQTSTTEEYTAQDIEVLEGLEPVRKRPGMYIGGTDENALHHLVNEVFDNSMDEAVAGHATRIELSLSADMMVTVADNGRGIPVDPHPKFPDKSALEVILTTLHSGGKFSSKAYETSGGLHGVGISVVNALSDYLTVEVARNKQLYEQSYSQGKATTKLDNIGPVANRRGTKITFHPDPEIFDVIKFKPARMYNFAKSKAYLYKGVEIRWSCDPSLLDDNDEVPPSDVIKFPNGLQSFLEEELYGQDTISKELLVGEAKLADEQGKVEWAIAWPLAANNFVKTYCNTIPTPLGGTHEAGLRLALSKAIKSYGELTGNKKASNITPDDIFGDACVVLSLFIKEPQFQGQTKDKLVNKGVSKLVENALRDYMDHWLTDNKDDAALLLEHFIAKADERLKAKQKDVSRKSVVQKLRLPGKLTDCTREIANGTEIFLVEGDSAGGSAKQARNRETQAILPLRGKILNVASATADKILANNEISDIELALGCGMGSKYSDKELRYEKVIIMTDADVDGAHIASLLMTFFYRQMPGLIRNGHLYLALPPLYRLQIGKQFFYANDEADRDRIIAEHKKGNMKVETGRFKGLGEMTAPQLKETTMNPQNRTLLKVVIADDEEAETSDLVERLMGKKPEHRLKFIQEESAALHEKGIELDV